MSQSTEFVVEHVKGQRVADQVMALIRSSAEYMLFWMQTVGESERSAPLKMVFGKTVITAKIIKYSADGKGVSISFFFTTEDGSGKKETTALMATRE